MKYDSVFDVLGRIMVGPSSSHTAGACRIGFIAEKIFGKIPSDVTIYLHGSFAETYRGHKTDVALIGGLLGLKPDSEDLPRSKELAEEANMNWKIEMKDLGPDIHPNSVELYLSKEVEGNLEELSLVASSIGGGNIIIIEIDGMIAGFNGNSPTIIETHDDKQGVLAKIMNVISNHGINVNQMRLSRKVKKKLAMSWIEISQHVPDELLADILAIPEVIRVRCLDV